MTWLLWLRFVILAMLLVLSVMLVWAAATDRE
jgi:hypothetical protein